MKVVPNEHDTQKWVNFFKGVADGKKFFRSKYNHRNGLGNIFQSLRRYAVPIVSVTKPEINTQHESKAVKIVSPSQAVVEQAKYEIEREPSVNIVDVNIPLKKSVQKRVYKKKNASKKTSNKKSTASKSKSKGTAKRQKKIF